MSSSPPKKNTRFLFIAAVKAQATGVTIRTMSTCQAPRKGWRARIWPPASTGITKYLVDVTFDSCGKPQVTHYGFSHSPTRHRSGCQGWQLKRICRKPNCLVTPPKGTTKYTWAIPKVMWTWDYVGYVACFTLELASFVYKYPKKLSKMVPKNGKLP